MKIICFNYKICEIIKNICQDIAILILTHTNTITFEYFSINVDVMYKFYPCMFV